MKTVAIVVAAGEGKRLAQNDPKVYVSLCGRPMLLRTLDKFCAARHVTNLVVVAAAPEVARCEALLRGDPGLKRRPWIVQSGGATRQESVKRGLSRVDADADIIAIHDAARPFVSSQLIDRCVETAYDRGAAAVGLPARDTIKLVSSERWVQSTPERSSLWEIQTPQAFRSRTILEAHDWAAAHGLQGTDDAVLVERMGIPVYVLEGERTNFKITLPDDLVVAEALIRDGRVS
jgi:2-C-methyl-D-erythritol 4-phosphate cytidylyltransferase/2-C-methyl-D-erythritol 4-phosphate cytidylyltransferase/2-C-methyl-D-erythritol 2,4-cyclodiphosphate synthase